MQNKDGLWEVIGLKYLIEKPWCTVRQDHVKLPSGIEIPNYYVLEYDNWVNILAITKEQEFVFIKQYRHGLKIRTYELPAGACDNTDASPLEAAKRELLEETGYGNGKWEELMVVSANPGTHTNLCYCYLATDVEKISAQHLEATEDIEVVLLTPVQVEEILKSDCIKQSMHAAPLWKYMATRN